MEHLNPRGAKGGRKGSLGRNDGLNEMRQWRAFWRIMFEAKTSPAWNGWLSTIGETTHTYTPWGWPGAWRLWRPGKAQLCVEHWRHLWPQERSGNITDDYRSLCPQSWTKTNHRNHCASAASDNPDCVWEGAAVGLWASGYKATKTEMGIISPIAFKKKFLLLSVSWRDLYDLTPAWPSIHGFDILFLHFLLHSSVTLSKFYNPSQPQFSHL